MSKKVFKFDKVQVEQKKDRLFITTSREVSKELAQVIGQNNGLDIINLYSSSVNATMFEKTNKFFIRVDAWFVPTTDLQEIVEFSAIIQNFLIVALKNAELDLFVKDQKKTLKTRVKNAFLDMAAFAYVKEESYNE